MKLCTLALTLLVTGAGAGLPATPVQAQELTPAQQKEVTAIRRELSNAGNLLRRKKAEEAKKYVDSAEAKLKKLIADGKLDPKGKTIASLNRQLELRKTTLEKVAGSTPSTGTPDTPKGTNPKMGGVSFVKDVAPILQRKCNGCHGNRPSGGLQMNNFANMRKGGSSGVLLQPGNANNSLLVRRLMGQGGAQMPRNAPALPASEIQTISKWINEGAKFDGDAETTALSSLRAPGAAPVVKKYTGPVTVLKPTGNETVSFTKDIAPFMVNLCLRCHSGNNPRSGFSIETFEKLLQGGNSGRVVVPGDLDGSRLWDLVGKQQPFKMPQGQALITRTNHRNLRIWIVEGARFDSPDPKATLRSLVPTEEELNEQKFAKMSAAEFAEHRNKRTKEIWEQANGDDPARTLETKEFVLWGDVSQARLQEVSTWAEAHAKSLRTTFNDKRPTLWRGKLAIYVAKDRFGYEEYNFSVLRRQTPRDMFGHSVVTKTTHEDAYIALQDVGNSVTEESPGMKVNLLDQLTAAYFLQGGSDIPNWVQLGTGLAFAAQVERQNEYLTSLSGTAIEALRAVQKPGDIFADGTFSPSGAKAVGFTLTQFLVKRGGSASYGRFVKELQDGTKMPDAIKKIYRVDVNTLARIYAGSLKAPPRR